jgi:hypothetical protein
MVKRLAALLLFFNCAIACAQTIKTDVLVIGGSPSGVAAAIQCARSKVKTVLIDEGTTLCSSMTANNMTTIKTDRDLPSGVWAEFRKRVVEHYKKTPGYDTSYNAPLQLQPDSGAMILANIADSVKDLDIKLQTTFIDIVKDDDRWQVSITQNGIPETIKARVIIDATNTGEIAAKAGSKAIDFDKRPNKGGLNLYRTSIAMGDFSPMFYEDIVAPEYNYPPYPTFFIPIKALVANGVDNILLSEKWLPLQKTIQDLSSQITIGQGAGVTAAYCAFYKTTTANLNVRAIQGELLSFKGYLLPLEDISADPYCRAIQQVCATGMLRGIQKGSGRNTQFLFMPDSTVTTAEVKPYLLEIYTRAFLWFNTEKPGEKFTVGNLLSFISELTLTDPENVKKNIGKAWNTQYKFTSAFDLNRPITRREFAILANKYLNPFGRAVDLNGRMVN